jgi:uncharacterized protein
VLSLVGDIAESADRPSLHATLEVVVTETPAELRKVMRPDLGIALIDLDRSES